MSKTLELLASVSKTNTPIGTCDLCGVEGPLKEVRVNKVKTFSCIPCVIDRDLS